MARLFAITFVVALHVGVALLLMGRWQPFARDAAEPEPPATSLKDEPMAHVTVRSVVDWTRAPDSNPAPSRETVAENVRVVVDLEQARAAGRDHARRWLEATRRIDRRRYGDAIAALLDAPPAQSWPALEQLVHEGDKVGVAALGDLAERCREFSRLASLYSRLAGDAVAGLDAMSAEFVRAALEQEQAYLRDFAARCREAGVGPARLEALVRARGDESGEDVVRDFVRLYDGESSSGWIGPFGSSLDQATGEGLSEDDWVELLAAAESDPAVAYAIGYCMDMDGNCTGFPELPETELHRLRRAAADAGNVRAARALAEDFANGGDLASAYGWLLFARWADATGCNPIATTLDLAQTLRGIASLEAVLSPGQRRAGEMLGASLVAANAAGARAVWSCPG